MKKIGIVSVQNNNYGSILQAYALQKALHDYNYDNEIINYKKSKLLQLKRLFNISLLRNIISNKTKFLKCKKHSKKSFYKVIVTRNDAFEKFKLENLFFSKVYKGKKSLIKGCYNYDNILVGSDQVWHPLNLSSKYYSLIFVPDDINTISYASSFGVSKIPKHQINKTKQYLNKINHISVREESGAKIISKLINRQAIVVLDPTLLIDRNEWNKIKSGKVIDKKYIFCYFIGTNEENRRIAKEFANNNDLEIVVLPHIDEYVKADEEYGTIFPEKIGPSEFIDLISNAEYVFTDSFHAAVFSIIYNKNFFVFERFNSNDKKSTNTRIYSLLSKINLTERICHNIKDVENNCNYNIDYSRINPIIEEERKKSVNFIKKAVK